MTIPVYEHPPLTDEKRLAWLARMYKVNRNAADFTEQLIAEIDRRAETEPLLRGFHLVQKFAVIGKREFIFETERKVS